MPIKDMDINEYDTKYLKASTQGERWELHRKFQAKSNAIASLRIAVTEVSILKK